MHESELEVGSSGESRGGLFCFVLVCWWNSCRCKAKAVEGREQSPPTPGLLWRCEILKSK